MLAHLSQWILIAALSQASPEAALLKSAPAEVDVAVRTRGLEATRDDVLALLRSMNPEWAKMAEGGLAGPLAQFREHHGAHAVTSPFIALIRLGEPGGEGGPPPFAVLVASDKYAETLKELAGGKEVELKHQDGDYDAFDGPDGHGTWYATKGPGIVAFGTSKGLIADTAKRGGKTLDAVLTGSPARHFLGGDIGVYVNAAALSSRYADQIEQARQTLMAVMDQAGQQAANAGAIQFAKDFYGGLFDSLKYADGLTVSLDAAETGLHLGGFLKVKSDSDAAKAIAGTRKSDAGSLGNLPRDAMAYISMNVETKTFDRLQGMSLKMLSAGGKPSPELEKAVAELHGLGRIETIGSVSMEKGMRSLNDIQVADPKKYMDASVAVIRAMSGGKGQASLYKDLKVEPDAQTHQGMAFTHVAVSIDLDKLAEMSGNAPGQLETMKAMFGDGKINYWYGTDGKQVLQVVAPNWEDARSLIDGYLKGVGGVGQTAGFKAVRTELPQEVSVLLLFETQALVRMYVNLFSGILKKPDLKLPDDMPKEPAFLGASLTPHPSEGYEFHLVVPSTVGTVIAKGVVPMVQGLAPPGANQ
jgi:hypothetical protein